MDGTGGCLVGSPGVGVLPWVSVPQCGGVDEVVNGSVVVPGKSPVVLSCRWTVRVQVVESNGVAIGVDSIGDCGMEVSGAGSVLSEVK